MRYEPERKKFRALSKLELEEWTNKRTNENEHFFSSFLAQKVFNKI